MTQMLSRQARHPRSRPQTNRKQFCDLQCRNTKSSSSRSSSRSSGSSSSSSGGGGSSCSCGECILCVPANASCGSRQRSSCRGDCVWAHGVCVDAVQYVEAIAKDIPLKGTDGLATILDVQGNFSIVVRGHGRLSLHAINSQGLVNPSPTEQVTESGSVNSAVGSLLQRGNVSEVQNFRIEVPVGGRLFVTLTGADWELQKFTLLVKKVHRVDASIVQTKAQHWAFATFPDVLELFSVCERMMPPSSSTSSSTSHLWSPLQKY